MTLKNNSSKNYCKIIVKFFNILMYSMWLLFWLHIQYLKFILVDFLLYKSFEIPAAFFSIWNYILEVDTNRLIRVFLSFSKQPTEI